MPEFCNGYSSTLQRFARCLMWVFYAARPLRIKELLEAVQIEESAGRRAEEAVSEVCANLIEVNYGFVRPIYLSVKEYFIVRVLKSLSRGLAESVEY
jgi:hypothetical protein